MTYGTGRIGEVIDHLESKFGQTVTSLSPQQKVDALCESIQMPVDVLDSLISDNSPVFRTVKGHVFESFFDHLLTANRIDVKEVGGDDVVDRIVNSHTLQLKTCTEAGTKGTVAQYKTHKTHGAKSEQESMDYYHKLDHFADYLIGHISYNPLRIIVLDKYELPTHPKSKLHILSPFTVSWKNHPGLNAFHRLGIKLDKLDVSLPRLKEVLPKTSLKIGVSSDIILNTILNNANFRVWDMSIRGFSREVIFSNIVRSHGIKIYMPSELRTNRADKADHALKLKQYGNVFIQMKGVSTNNCDFSLTDPVIGTETQLTRGRVNDHPTQSRLYLCSDFDFLVLGIDPPIVSICRERIGLGKKLEWEFYLIPTSILDVHHNMPHRLKSLQKFKYSELQKYKITNFSKQLT